MEKSINLIGSYIDEYPEFSHLVADTEYSPETHAEAKVMRTVGQYFFPQASKDQVREFDRTALSLIVLSELLDGSRAAYERLTRPQAGSPTKLTYDTFQKLAAFYSPFNARPGCRRVLEYYTVVNDYGKILKAKEGIAPAQEEADEVALALTDHDQVLARLIENNKVPSIMAHAAAAELVSLPTLLTFHSSQVQMLEAVVQYGFNVGQVLQGEAPFALTIPFRDQLSLDAKRLVLAEAIVDIAGVTGQENQLGTIVLNEPMAENLLYLTEHLESDGLCLDYVMQKVDAAGLFQLPDVKTMDEVVAIARLGLMLRLQPAEFKRVAEFILTRKPAYQTLISELGTNIGRTAILPYYAPALLSNVRKHFKGSPDDVEKTLELALPYLQARFTRLRCALTGRENLPRVVNLQLRQAALNAEKDPDSLKL